MHINKSGSVPAAPVEMEGARDVVKAVLVGPDEDSKNIIMRQFTISPGGHTPRHQHDSEHVVTILDGKGLVLDGSGREHEVSPGDSLFVPPNEEHQFRNPFDERFVFLCIILGPGRT